LENSLYYSTVDNLDEKLISYRYEIEGKIMNLISTGNINGMKDLIQEIHIRETQSIEFSTQVNRIPTDPLRSRKNGIVIRNTFCRIGAKNGGLPLLYVHLISEKYALKIENADSVEYLEDVLFVSLLMEYTEAVHKFSTLPYSKLIKDVVSYITQNLTNEMNLTLLSNFFHVHPSHLARKFKQETGLTIIDYIQHHRINYAKLLFQEGNTNILDVANLSGFNSSSYFDKVFKKITSQTPSAYLKANHLKTTKEK
jgi:two-component system, response regulator YesN